MATDDFNLTTYDYGHEISLHDRVYQLGQFSWELVEKQWKCHCVRARVCTWSFFQAGELLRRHWRGYVKRCYGCRRQGCYEWRVWPGVRGEMQSTGCVRAAVMLCEGGYSAQGVQRHNWALVLGPECWISRRSICSTCWRLVFRSCGGGTSRVRSRSGTWFHYITLCQESCGCWKNRHPWRLGLCHASVSRLWALLLALASKVSWKIPK